MSLGISNIAWPTNLDNDVASLLTSRGVYSVDIAPSKYFDLSAAPRASEAEEVRYFWESKGFLIRGMQSLMYGSALNIFGSDIDREDMLAWLDNLCRIGAHLGASRLVFGSPKNRFRVGMSQAESLVIATEFFMRLGDIAERHRVSICLEPNPIEYGANFLISSSETADFVQSLDHPAIRMQLDTGAMVLCGEEEDDLLENVSEIVGHIHLSAPGLKPLHQSDLSIVEKLEWALGLPGDFVPTIEMLTTGPALAAEEIELTIDFLYEVTSLKNRGTQP